MGKSMEMGLSDLILYSVILNWKKFEKCSAPSDMYHMVESVQGSREAALKLFLFYLKAIVRGKRAVEVMCC